MTDPEIQLIADRVILALQNLAPGPAGWWVPWTAWGSYATVIAAVVALIIGLRTLKQKKDADARAEWWRRTQWALEATAGTDEMYTYGTRMLRRLSGSTLTSDEDKELLDTVWQDTATEMDDAKIRRLVDAARAKSQLTSDEQDVILSFEPVDEILESRDNGATDEDEEGKDNG